LYEKLAAHLEVDRNRIALALGRNVGKHTNDTAADGEVTEKPFDRRARLGVSASAFCSEQNPNPVAVRIAHKGRCTLM
jgi:hypothetical protein